MDRFDAGKFIEDGIDPKVIHAIQLLQSEDPRQSNSDFIRPEEHKQKLIDIRVSDVDSSAIFEMSKRSVIAVASFVGFHEIEDEARDSLAKLLNQKLDKMVGNLHTLISRIRRGRPTSFQNPAHQVLHLHNLTVPNLYNFYQNRVIYRYDSVLKRSEEEDSNKNSQVSSSHSMKLPKNK